MPPKTTSRLSRPPEIKYKEGDIIAVPDGSVIVHSCNTNLGWGAGVAAKLKQTFPAAERQEANYRKVQREKGNNLLGRCLLIPPQKGDKKPYAHEMAALGNFVAPDATGIWIACLYSKSVGGAPKAGESAELMLHFMNALEDLRNRYSAAKGAGRPIGDIYCPPMNAGIFSIPWGFTGRLLRHSGLHFNVWFLNQDPRLDSERAANRKRVVNDELNANAKYRKVLDALFGDGVSHGSSHQEAPRGKVVGPKAVGASQGKHRAEATTKRPTRVKPVTSETQAPKPSAPTTRRQAGHQPKQQASQAVAQTAQAEEARVQKRHEERSLLNVDEPLVELAKFEEELFRAKQEGRRLTRFQTAQLEKIQEAIGSTSQRGRSKSSKPAAGKTCQTASNDEDDYSDDPIDPDEQLLDLTVDDVRQDIPDSSRPAMPPLHTIPVPLPRIALLAGDPRYTLYPVASTHKDKAPPGGSFKFFGKHMRDERGRLNLPVLEDGTEGGWQDTDINEPVPDLEEGEDLADVKIPLSAAESRSIEKEARKLFGSAETRPGVPDPGILFIAGVPRKVLIEKQNKLAAFKEWRVHKRAQELWDARNKAGPKAGPKANEKKREEQQRREKRDLEQMQGADEQQQEAQARKTPRIKPKINLKPKPTTDSNVGRRTGGTRQRGK